MIKSLSLLGLSHFARIASNTLIFVFLARMWGPEKFGHFMYLFAISNIIALASDLGAQNYLLEAIGADKKSAPNHFKAMLSARYRLTSLIYLIAFSYMQISLDFNSKILFAILLTTAFVTTFTELQMIPLRALDKLGSEARDTTIISLITVLFIGATAYIFPSNVFIVASGLLSARITALLVAQKRRKTTLGPAALNTPSLSWKKILPFGIDSAITNFSSGLDSILMQFFSGSTGVGLYQAGGRLAQGALTFSPVVAGVFIPRLAGRKNSVLHHSFLDRPSTQLRLLMSGIGLLSGSFFILLGPWIVVTLYGSEYNNLSAMMPWFGISVHLRYLATGAGVVLSATGSQWTRLSSKIVFLIILSSVSFLLSESMGMLAVVIALAIANFCMFSINLYGVYISDNQHKPSRTELWIDIVSIVILTSYTLATFHPL